MHMQIDQVTAKDVRGYLKARIRALCLAGGSPAEEINDEYLETHFGGILQGPGELPNLASREEVERREADLTEAQERLVSRRRECARGEADGYAPLVDGEEVVSERFTFLTEHWLGMPAFTPALRRETNKGSYTVFFEDMEVRGPRLLERPTRPEPPVVSAQLLGSKVGDLVEKLALAAAKGFGSKIGGEVFKLIVGLVMNDYFDVNYDEIRRIVEKSLTDTEISKINGILSGTARWMDHTYLPMKDSGAPRHDLADELRPQAQKMYDVVGILQQEQFAEPGFSVFLIAAPMHLLILQEQALVDPNQQDPKKSSFAKSVAGNAGDYATFTDATWKKIAATRRGMVGVYPDVVCDLQACVTNGYYFQDSFNRHKSHDYVSDKNGKSGRQKAREAADDYRESRVRELSSNLGGPKTVSSQLKALKTKPIP